MFWNSFIIFEKICLLSLDIINHNYIFQYMEKEQVNKPHLNLTVIGDAQSGKSTLVGRLLCLLGEVSEEELSKLENQGVEQGIYSRKYSWVVDKMKEQREKGTTIHIHYSKIETNQRHFTIIDTPGSQSRFKNSITGIVQADCCILVINSQLNEFEKSIAGQGNTKNLTIASFVFGVKNMIVCVDKMDNTYVNYSEERFQEIKKAMYEFLKTVGYNPSYIPFIPVSALQNDNLVEKSPKMPWYKGPTLIELLNGFKVPKRELQKPLRLVIEGSFNVKEVGVVGRGKIQAGILKPFTQVLIAPLQQKKDIGTIEIDMKNVEKGADGDLVSFRIDGINTSELKRGCVIGNPLNSPPRNVQEITAQIVLMNPVGEIVVGYSPVFHIHTASVQLKITSMTRKIDKQKGTLIEENPQRLVKDDCAIVTLTPMKPLSCQIFHEYPKLGRFLAVDMKQIVLVGVVKNLKYAGDP